MKKSIIEKKSKTILSILLLLSSMFFFPFISSANAITLQTPAQDASISGTSYVINATLDTNTLQITNATFYYSDDSGVTWTTIIANLKNDTAVGFNTTFDTTSLVDVNNLIFNVTTSNDTVADVLTADTSTGVDIDNGNPTSSLTSSSFHNNYAVGGDDNYLIAIDADATIGISSCNVYYTNDRTGDITAQAVSASGNACTTTTTANTQSLTLGDSYAVTMEAVDGNSDKVNSTIRTLVVRNVGGELGGGLGTSILEEKPGIIKVITDIPKNAFNSLSEGFSTIINWIQSIFK